MPSSLAATISAAVVSFDSQDAPIWLQTTKVAVRLKNLSGLGTEATGSTGTTGATAGNESSSPLQAASRLDKTRPTASEIRVFFKGHSKTKT
jgi:hypothetical protein